MHVLRYVRGVACSDLCPMALRRRRQGLHRLVRVSDVVEGALVDDDRSEHHRRGYSYSYSYSYSYQSEGY